MPLFPACSQHDSGVAKHHQKHSQHGQGGGDVEKCAAETSDAQVDPSLVKFLLPKLLTALHADPGAACVGQLRLHVEKHWPISRHGQNGRNGQNGLLLRIFIRVQGFPPVLHSALQGLRPSVHLQNFHCLWLKRNTDGWAKRPRLGRSGRIWEVMSQTQKPADVYIEYSAGSASEHPVWKSLEIYSGTAALKVIPNDLSTSATQQDLKANHLHPSIHGWKMPKPQNQKPVGCQQFQQFCSGTWASPHPGSQPSTKCGHH